MMHRRLRTRAWVVALVALIAMAGLPSPLAAAPPSPPPTGYVLRGTVVTMNTDHDIFPDGRVLVRNGIIQRMWTGDQPPPGLNLGGVATVDAGPGGLIFPGLINLHDHPDYGILPRWLPPSSHVQADKGRPKGTEPYANRYQWGTDPTRPLEQARLVKNAYDAVVDGEGLGRRTDALKYTEARAALGGQTAIQGTSDPSVSNRLVRNVDAKNFGRTTSNRGS